jgi:hypothetical protein
MSINFITPEDINVEEIEMPKLTNNKKNDNVDKYLKLNCLDVANHIQYCPLCSEYYKCDTSSYTITITIMSMIIIGLIIYIIGIKK